VCVDLIGPWNINTTDNEAPVTLLALTTIKDLATSWFVITPLPNKGSETVAIAIDQQWLCKYPHPLQSIHDNGSEFVVMEFQERLAASGIRVVITTIANPQASAIFECIHQVIANMLCTSNPITDAAATKFRFEQQLHATQWAINTTYRTTLKALPSQLVHFVPILVHSSSESSKTPYQLAPLNISVVLFFILHIAISYVVLGISFIVLVLLVLLVIED